MTTRPLDQFLHPLPGDDVLPPPWLGSICVMTGAILILGVGGFARYRGRRDAACLGGHLSRLTRILMLVAFGGFGTTVVVAACMHAWPLALPYPQWSEAALDAAGIASLIIGAFVVISVFVGSRKRTWAVDTDELATTGIYGRTRNPRALGWFLIYLGLALVTHSGAALLLSPIFLLGYLPWILLEEVALEEHFGDEYRAYRRRTPRFLWPTKAAATS